MKYLSTILLAIVAAVGVSQEMMEPLPTELEVLKSWLGNWKADMTFSFGPEETKGTDVQVAKMSLGGRYFEATHLYSMGSDMPSMEGRQLITYDASKKKWIGYWFDAMSPGVMEMEGTVTANEVILTSKPTEMPGSPTPIVIRSTTTRLDKDSCTFRLEMKQGDSWMTLLKGTYKRQS